MSKNPDSPWRTIRTPRKPRGSVQATVPINRMNEVDSETRDALPKFAAEAWSKEFELKKAQGPHSVGEQHYEQVVKAIPYPREEE